MKANKIKVLHVVGSMTAGGIETLLMNIYRDIDRDKIQFDFAVQTQEKCFYDDEIERLGGRIISHPKPQRNLRDYKSSLKQTIEQYGPYDVIHSHVLFFSGIVLEVAKQQNVPVRIAHSHSVSRGRKSISRRIYEKYMSYIIKKNATNMLGCSHVACKSIFGSFPDQDKKIEYLPNAIRLQDYATIDNYKLENTKSNTCDLVITHIGRFVEAKNHEFLLDVFQELLKDCPSAKLRLIGQGPLEETIKAKAKQLKINGNIDFLGTRKDIPQILAQSDVLVLPSINEGLGIVVIEAQAAGIPCIVSDNVPKEADMELNMVKFLSLETSTRIWASALQNCRKQVIPKENTRQLAIHRKKYSTESIINRLLQIYM
jgi:glycosyltransferase involved in cell wall biosynthesis